MAIELTTEQRQALRERTAGPVQVVDPETLSTYVLIPSEQFEVVRPAFEANATARATAVAPAISPAMLRSQQAYWRDLPELLRNRKLRGQWVCYHGETQVGIRRTDTELVQLCLKSGWERGTFYIGRIKERPTPPWEPKEIEESLFEAEDEPQRSAADCA